MKRDLRFSADALHFGVSDHSVVLDFGDGSVADWCLELALLQRGLVDSLTIRSDVLSVRIRVEPSISSSERGCYQWMARDRLDLELSENELDYWSDFFFRYYRDGIGDVDHIDSEARHRAGEHSDLDLVLKVGRSRAPISGEEARRRLGL